MNNFNFNNGYMAGQVAPVKNSSTLSKEQYALLVGDGKKTGIKLSPDATDIARCSCNHRNPNTGERAWSPDAYGVNRCSICGREVIEDTNFDIHVIKESTDFIMKLFDSIKFMYIGTPEAVSKNFYAAMAFVELLPNLYDAAVASVNKITGAYDKAYTGVGTSNPFVLLNGITSGNMYGAMNGYNNTFNANPYGYGAPQYNPNMQPNQANHINQATDLYGNPINPQQYGYAPQYNPNPQFNGSFNPAFNAFTGASDSANAMMDNNNTTTENGVVNSTTTLNTNVPTPAIDSSMMTK